MSATSCSMKKVCWEVRFNKTYTLDIRYDYKI